MMMMMAISKVKVVWSFYFEMMAMWFVVLLSFLPVVQEVKAGLQDVAARVELRGKETMTTLTLSCRKCFFPKIPWSVFVDSPGQRWDCRPGWEQAPPPSPHWTGGWRAAWTTGWRRTSRPGCC